MRGLFHPNNRPIHKNARNNQLISILAVMMLAGVFAGGIAQAVLYKRQDTYLAYFIQKTLDLYRNAGFWTVCGRFFLSCFLLHITALFFALSCIGAPCLWGLVFLKGFSSGVLSAALYLQQGFRGAAANLLLFWLPDVARSVCLLVFLVPAMRSCSQLFQTHVLSKSVQTVQSLHQTEQIFLWTGILYLPCSLLAALLNIIFAPIFLR